MDHESTVTEPQFIPGIRKPTIWETLTNEKNFRWTLLIPLLILLAIFMLYPLLYSIYFSFHDWDMQGAPVFSGLRNYRQLVSDQGFLSAFGRTLEVLVICIAAELIIGLGLAMLWNRDFKGQNIVRGLALLPLLVAPLILSLLWNFILDFNFGMVNQILSAVGLPRVNLWAPKIALFTICAITIWQWLPFSTFVLLAGLKSLPRDVFEAAKVDSATPWYTFRRLTLPMLTPLIMIIIVLRSMWLIRLFDPLFGTTRGGVNTELLDWVTYRTAFVMFDIGYGSAMAIVSWAFTMILCMLMFRQLMKALAPKK
ncbi:MAG: sugar ABC transporter permease [Spirochaetia bacterium]|jgi:multiple sugar transport system permease protein